MSMQVPPGGEYGFVGRNVHKHGLRKIAGVGLAAILGGYMALNPFNVADTVDVLTGSNGTEQQLRGAAATAFGNLSVNCADYPGSWLDLFSQPRARTDTIPFLPATIHMRKDTCAAAISVQRAELFPADSAQLHAASTAVLDLAYEGEHAQGENDNGAALCKALQYYRQLASGLGASVAVMDQLQNDMVPRLNKHQLDPYDSIDRPDGCYDGGSLDVHPASSDPDIFFGNSPR
jgi:hypothetical protein